jgi:hypothetical protein
MIYVLCILLNHPNSEATPNSKITGAYCTPGLPYKDSLVYVIFNWRISFCASLPDFFTCYWCIFSPFLNIILYVYSFNVSDLFSHIQTPYNSSEFFTCAETGG